jgi:hypothetical protein
MTKRQIYVCFYRNQGLGSFVAGHISERDDGPIAVVRSEAGKRVRMARPNQRARQDHGDHAHSRPGTVARCLRPPSPHPRARRDRSSAVRPDPGINRRGSDMGRAPSPNPGRQSSDTLRLSEEGLRNLCFAVRAQAQYSLFLVTVVSMFCGFSGCTATNQVKSYAGSAPTTEMI